MNNLGTPIHELHKQEDANQIQNINATNFMGDMSYGAMQNLHSEQAHSAQHAVHQAQHAPYYNNNPNYTDPHFDQSDRGVRYTGSTTHLTSELPDIEYLTKKINDELPDDTIMGDVFDHFDNTVTTKDKKTYRYAFLEKMPKILVESLIILLVYILISQPFVRDTIGKYIKQINPGAKREVSLTGIVIYGLILVVLYSVIKKFLLQ